MLENKNKENYMLVYQLPHGKTLEDAFETKE